MIHTRLSCAALALTALSSVAHGATCSVQAPATPPTVVELYTSEGCSSCPPADRWLSQLHNDGRTLALGFHVNYWDHLGWRDRLATPETTQRQRDWKTALAAPYVYTPQIIVNGADERRWRQLDRSRLPQPAPAEVPRLTLARDGRRVTAEIGALPDGQQLAGYWAVLDDQVRHDVTRGENAGRTLVHDNVVRLYRPVAAWVAAQPWRQTLELPPDPVLDRARVAFVVTAGDGLCALQAASLACPPGQGAPAR